MLKIYHYERCSKSNEAFCILESKQTDYSIRYYIKEPLNFIELKNLQQKLNIPAIEMIRTNESIFKELFTNQIPDENELFKAVEKHPILLQRPIIEFEEKAIIARPPELVLNYI